jgi:hypothetical protein
MSDSTNKQERDLQREMLQMKLVDLLWEEVKNLNLLEESLDREQFRGIILQRAQRDKGHCRNKRKYMKRN